MPTDKDTGDQTKGTGGKVIIPAKNSGNTTDTTGSTSGHEQGIDPNGLAANHIESQQHTKDGFS